MNSCGRSRTYTAAELLAFSPDCHFELVGGKLRELDMPTGGAHGRITARISARIAVFVEENDLGDCYAAETGFLLRENPDTVLAPDFAYVSRARRATEQSAGFVRAVPDLVLETRSLSDRSSGVATKIGEWLSAGVSMALDLDPQRRQLTVHRPDNTFEGEDILPGFSLPLKRLFE